MAIRCALGISELLSACRNPRRRAILAAWYSAPRCASVNEHSARVSPDRTVSDSAVQWAQRFASKSLAGSHRVQQREVMMRPLQPSTIPPKLAALLLAALVTLNIAWGQAIPDGKPLTPAQEASIREEMTALAPMLVG